MIIIILFIGATSLSANNEKDNMLSDGMESIKEMLNLDDDELSDAEHVSVSGYDELKSWIRNYSGSNDTKAYIINLEDGDYNATDNIYFYDLNQKNKHITINGNGHVIDGQNKYQTFSLDKSKLTLKNLVIENTKYDSRNSAGAIVMLSPSELNIENCTFRNNHGDKKGSVITNRGNTTIKESIFINNSVNEVGGAIWSTGEYGGFLNLSNNTFRENNANMNHDNERTGIIYCVAGGNNTIDNNNFIKNRGRCIHCFNNTSTHISNNHFIQNNLSFDEVIRGGIIDNYEADIIIHDNIFEDDLTDGELRGGILYHEIGKLEFYNNKVENTHIHKKVTSNADCSKGGAIFNRNATAEIYNNTFNTIIKSDLARGGAIYNNLGNITLKDNTFTNTIEGKDIQGLCIHNDANGIINASSNSFNTSLDGSYVGDDDKEKYIYNSNQKNSEGSGVKGITNYI